MISNPFISRTEDGKLKMVPPFVIYGFVTAAIFISAWSIAAALDGHWIFGWNALSDLGVCNHPASRILFNYGCVLTAVFGGLFGMGIYKYEHGWMALAGIFITIGILALMGVGTIPESYGEPHYASAVIFGAFACMGMVCTTIADFKKGRKYYAAFALFLLLMCLFMQVFRVQFGYFEAFAILNILFWVMSQSYKYYKLIGFVEVDDPFRQVFDENWKIQ